MNFFKIKILFYLVYFLNPTQFVGTLRCVVGSCANSRFRKFFGCRRASGGGCTSSRGYYILRPKVLLQVRCKDGRERLQ